MDVSQRTAEALDFHSAGTTKVKVEWIGRANLAGDDDRKLLATLRDDGSAASLDAFQPLMALAAKPERVRTAAIMPPEREPEPAAQPVANDLPSRPTQNETMAYAGGAESRPEPLSEPSASRESEIDESPVGATHEKVSSKVKAFQAAPLPPTRPASIDNDAASIPTPPMRHALN
jgi:rare lipoprotein A